MDWSNLGHERECILSPFVTYHQRLTTSRSACRSPVDTASTGMDPHPTSPRAELDLMTEQDLARHLKVCRRQLYNWRMAGLIPYFKLGKAVRFRVADVTTAIERMRLG